MYIRHGERKLHLAVRGQAAEADMTVSEYVTSVMRYFLGLSPEAQKRALKKK